MDKILYIWHIMKWVFAILYLLIVTGDVMAVSRVSRRSVNKRKALTWAILAAMTDLLPLVAVIIQVASADNTQSIMRITMWSFTVYFITAIPRGIFYLFAIISQKRPFMAIGCLASLFVAGYLIYGLIVGRKRIVINETTICSDMIPSSFDGFRIVHFSDLHVGTLLSPSNETRAIVDTINSLDADLVVFSGDLVTVRYSELDDEVMSMLARITARCGIVSSVGNHDTGLYVKDSITLPKEESRRRLIRREKEMGWTVLDDSTMYLRRGADSISVSGISFPDEFYEFRHLTEVPEYDISHVYDSVPPDMFNITISHIPQMWRRITSLGYGDLTLAGHVHAMQAKLHVGERGISPAELLYEEWSGRYECNGSTLYINDGTGYVGLYMRLGAWPEITVLTLKSRKTESKYPK